MFKLLIDRLTITFYRHWPLAITLLVSLGLRVYRFPELASFDFDQEYAANFSLQVLQYPIRLIGQGMSVQGLFMGPWFFYLMTPFFWLTRLHPLGGYLGSILLGLVTISVYYWLANRMFGRPAAIMAAFCRGLLFIYISADWAIVPSYSSDLIVILLWYWLYLYWCGSKPPYFYAGILLGLFTSWHPIQLPFYVVFLVIFITRRPRFNLKNFAKFAFAYLLVTSPLIIFEYLRNFAMTKQIIAMFTHSNSTTSINYLSRISQFPSIFADHIAQHVAVPWHFPIYRYALLAVFTVLIISIGRRFSQFHYWSLACLAWFLLYYLFFPTHVPQYYFAGATTLITLYFSALASFFYPHRYGKILLALWITFVLYQTAIQLTQRYTNPSLLGIAHKDAIVQAIKTHSQGHPVYISYITSPGWNFGYKYLLDWYAIPQVAFASQGPVYTIVSPRSLSIDSLDVSYGNVGLIYPDN